MSAKELSPEDRQHLQRWLEEKAGEHFSCSVCNHRKWAIAPHIVTTLAAGDGIWLGGPNYPSAAVICTNCGNTVFINAIIAGLVTPEGSENQTGEASRSMTGK